MPGLGCFHYPRKIGKEKAFEMLKNSMIELRENEIKQIQSQIESLKNLKVNDDKLA